MEQGCHTRRNVVECAVPLQPHATAGQTVLQRLRFVQTEFAIALVHSPFEVVHHKYGLEHEEAYQNQKSIHYVGKRRHQALDGQFQTLHLVDEPQRPCHFNRADQIGC